MGIGVSPATIRCQCGIFTHGDRQHNIFCRRLGKLD
jgi:hypothetical protein